MWRDENNTPWKSELENNKGCNKGDEMAISFFWYRKHHRNGKWNFKIKLNHSYNCCCYGNGTRDLELILCKFLPCLPLFSLHISHRYLFLFKIKAVVWILESHSICIFLGVIVVKWLYVWLLWLTMMKSFLFSFFFHLINVFFPFAFIVPGCLLSPVNGIN